MQDAWFFNDKSQNILNGLNWSDKLYRILPLNFFLDLLMKKEISFSNVAKQWADPFENFLYSLDIIYNGHPVTVDKLKETVYGQSWSIAPESDAMWRIYSSAQDGVKIRVTVDNLMTQLWGTGSDARINLYCGKVQYLSGQQIQQWLLPKTVREALLEDEVNQKTANYALLKRMEFQHEQEARLVYIVETESHLAGQDRIFFPIDPATLIEEVVLDPHLSDSAFQAFETQIRTAGYAGSVTRSTLYGPPRFTVSI